MYLFFIFNEFFVQTTTSYDLHLHENIKNYLKKLSLKHFQIHQWGIS